MLLLRVHRKKRVSNCTMPVHKHPFWSTKLFIIGTETCTLLSKLLYKSVPGDLRTYSKQFLSSWILSYPSYVLLLLLLYFETHTDTHKWNDEHSILIFMNVTIYIYDVTGTKHNIIVEQGMVGWRIDIIRPLYVAHSKQFVPLSGSI